MKQVVVGTYEMGWEMVELVLREGRGGEFYLLPGDINYARVKVGADNDWVSVVEVLLHEIAELASMRIQCRFAHSNEMARDHHAYLFVMNHPQFAEVQALTADYVCRCWDDFKEAHRKWGAPPDEVTTA